jgi:hypothetical protein
MMSDVDRFKILQEDVNQYARGAITYTDLTRRVRSFLDNQRQDKIDWFNHRRMDGVCGRPAPDA